LTVPLQFASSLEIHYLKTPQDPTFNSRLSWDGLKPQILEDDGDMQWLFNMNFNYILCFW